MPRCLSSLAMLLDRFSSLSDGWSAARWECMCCVDCIISHFSSASEHVLSDVVTFLGKCVDPKNGGYGGGPQQLAHLAPTYAAINAISGKSRRNAVLWFSYTFIICAVMGTEEGYKSVDRRAVSGFLHAVSHKEVLSSFFLLISESQMKHECGGFRMHHDGEVLALDATERIIILLIVITCRLTFVRHTVLWLWDMH